jgi:hypothetical protein|tara:strand:- start:4414 stop:4518 length:105 start_codon:yes stop_codon:yes gene_type:complete
MKDWIDSLQNIDKIAFKTVGAMLLIILLTEWLGG